MCGCRFKAAAFLGAKSCESSCSGRLLTCSTSPTTTTPTPERIYQHQSPSTGHTVLVNSPAPAARVRQGCRCIRGPNHASRRIGSYSVRRIRAGQAA